MEEEVPFFSKPTLILFIIIIIGVLGNLLNLIIFSDETMKKHSTFRYLFYLSIVDLLVLTVCTTDSLTTYGYKLTIRLYSPFSCRLYTFFTYYLSQMSSVVLMVVSIDRALTVSNRTFVSIFSKIKFDSRKMSDFSNITLMRTNNNMTLANKSKYKIEEVLICICIVLALFNFHYLIFLNINPASPVKSTWLNVKQETNVELRPEFNQTFLNLIDSDSKLMVEYLTNETEILDLIESQTQTSQTKSTQSCQSNMSIYLKNKKLESQNQSNMAEQIDVDKLFTCFPNKQTNYFYFLTYVWIWIDTCIYSLFPFIIMVICSICILAEVKSKTRNFSNRNMNEKSNRRNRQLLIMLSITNAYFIVCSIPLCVNMILYKFKGLQYDTDLFQIISHILAYSNNSVNFIFYLLFSQKYRKVIVKLFYLKIMNKNDENATIANLAMRSMQPRSTCVNNRKKNESDVINSE